MDKCISCGGCKGGCGYGESSGCGGFSGGDGGCCCSGGGGRFDGCGGEAGVFSIVKVVIAEV